MDRYTLYWRKCEEILMIDYRKEMEKCTQCGECTAHCTFLQKYHLDFSLQQIERLKELSYSCFLCGTCKIHCPEAIDGSEIMQALRAECVNIDGQELVPTGFEKMIEEKADYLYKNYHYANQKSVIFMGCNFPAYFPKTARRISEYFLKYYQIGTVYECCGKPIMDLGLSKKAEKSLDQLIERMRSHQIEEVITVCPNCDSYLKKNSSMRVVTILQKMKELKIGNPIDYKDAYIFQACPDREKGEWMELVQDFFSQKVQRIETIQCCGLGGCAKAKEPELARGFTDQLPKGSNKRIYTYCASCAGNFRRNGCTNVRHILPEILGLPFEEADIQHNGENRKDTKNW